jgi:predicted lipid carrier protein YhbT
MIEPLSPEWFEESNERLRRASVETPHVGAHEQLSVVFDVPDAPEGLARAFTFSVDESGASVESGDRPSPDLSLRIGYHDVVEMIRGTLDSARAMREGRIKVRGDVASLVAVGQWMASAHRDSLPR